MPNKKDLTPTPMSICMYSLSFKFWDEEILIGIGNMFGINQARKIYILCTNIVYMNTSEPFPKSINPYSKMTCQRKFWTKITFILYASIAMNIAIYTTISYW